jgi:hypothetical protein
LVLVLVLGETGVAHAQKVKVQLAANLAKYNVQQVAILGLANTSSETEASQMATMLIRALNATGKYHFASAEQFATDAKRTGVGAEYERVRNTWLKKRVMEPEVVKRLLTATKFDAVVGMEVSRWEKKTVDPLEEGTSDTSVGVLVRMVAQDGTILWSASETKTVQSEPYLPSFNLRSTEGGEAVATGAVPQPPDIKKVATDLANEVVATMPAIKKTTAAPTQTAPQPAKDTPPAPAPVDKAPADTTAPADTSGSHH